MLPAFALPVAVLGAAALWLGLRLVLRGPGVGWCVWVAPLIALDVAFMLRLAAAPAGRLRAGLAVLGTAAAIAFGYWTVVAAEMAALIGLTIPESIQRLGPSLFWTLVERGTSAWEMALVVTALPLAWWLAR
ncbi:hypothetical protein P873_03990 [Arenimonas composti TR7-09 = DSM 18010]|uniref:Uncharacterized protein n=1 Tax=Arenimonas composti TR7-09 = DSM 18010 TaxID=1121013 RepID=A0A091BEG7_9GAMM|nr:hypothetical protein P873_03990 [Arenimonas composti TR7-09 = DSM 18010]